MPAPCSSSGSCSVNSASGLLDCAAYWDPGNALTSLFPSGHKAFESDPSIPCQLHIAVMCTLAVTLKLGGNTTLDADPYT